MLLQDKVAIITGGTRGIGFETARQFLLNGAKVAVFGSRKETVDTAVEKLKTENKDFAVIGLFPTLNSTEEVSNAFEQAPMPPNNSNSLTGLISIIKNLQ